MIDKVKMRRLCESLGDRLPQKTPSNESGGTLEEGEKKHHTPKFVQHCVAAITEKPKELKRIKKGGNNGEEGTPFAICWDNYNKNKKSLAAKHAKGNHHSVKDYEKSLKKLREAREAARAKRVDPRQIVFETRAPEHIKREARRNIRFEP
ncbi:MAG: hypothetical protein R3268_01575 [Acidiferrobacterales bacterium]|nr:hypothetical protein [Acidiferrobacterales bacterium]